MAPLIASLGDLSEAMGAVGEYVVGQSHRQFEVGGAPAWAPLKPATIKRKAEQGKTKSLIWDAILRNSIAYDAGKDSVSVGAGGPYALVHQFGSPSDSKQNIPARPYVVVSDEDRNTIGEIINEYLFMK